MTSTSTASPRRPHPRRALPAGPCLALAAVLALAGCPAAPDEAAPPPAADPVAAPSPLPGDSVYLLEGAFTDQDGRALTLAALRGRPRVVAMVFTHCAYACPRLTSDLQALEASLSPAAREATGFVLASFDHERDLPPRLAAYARERALAPGRWTLLHAGPDVVRELAAVLGVRYARQPSGAYGHSNRYVVLDADGRIVATVDGLEADPAPAREALERLAAPGAQHGAARRGPHPDPNHAPEVPS